MSSISLRPSQRPVRALLAAAAVCAGAAHLAACASSGHEPRSPEERGAATPAQHDEYGRLGYRLEWRGYPVLSGNGRLERMEVLGDVVAVQESGAELTVLEAKSGERRWNDPVGNALTKFVGLNRDGKRLIVSSESQAFFYDVDTGALLSKQNFAQVVNTRPAQVGEILVYGTTSGQVLGHLTLNGFRQWGSFVTGSIETDPALLGGSGVVAVLSREGDLALLDGVTGSMRGRNRTHGGSDAAMAATDAAVYIASNDNSLYAFSVDQAAHLFRVRTEAPLRFAPTVHEGRVYCDMGATGLTAFDAKTGKEQWHNADAHGSVIAVRAGRLLVWDGATATLVEPVRGGAVEAVNLKDISLVRTDQFVDGNLYLASKAGVVSKLVVKK